MARVPTWAELRIDATKLAHAQKECYDDIHNLLDCCIPELDRKLATLTGKPSTFNVKPPKFHAKQTKFNARQAKINGKQSMLSEEPSTFFRESSTPIKDRPTPIREPSALIEDLPTFNATKQTRIERDFRKLNLEDLELVKELSLPLPLSEYLRLNKPKMVLQANIRATYIKERAARRKYMASLRNVNLFEQARLSSRRSKSTRNFLKSTSRENLAPIYKVKYKFSEQEMKQLTKKHYNRLPEVKKQHNEEVTKHMRVQNYKNKLEYGRKLLENRRRGIINYPLKTNHDDSSIMSSQCDSFTSSYDRSADMYKSDSYF